VQKECMKDLNDGVLLVYRFLGSASDCSWIGLNMIRFADIDCACTHLLLIRKSSTWHVTVLQPGEKLQRIAVFFHKRRNAITVVTISSKLLFVLIYGKSFVHWQVHQ
jgi:hypothetical protein